MDNCKKCGEQQWSIMDRNYLVLFGHCWSCDREAWQAGDLSLEEFEARETRALKEKEEA